MSLFVDRLAACALSAGGQSEALLRAAHRIDALLYEPRRVTHRVAMDVFPAAQKRFWERDRPFVLEMIYAETSVDATPFMVFETYAVARAAGEWIHTAPVELAGQMVNVVPVPLKELERYDDWPVMMSACGQVKPATEATWYVRFVEEPMSDRWTGFVLLEILSLIESVAREDAVSPTDLSMKILFAETRRELLSQVFPNSPLQEIPRGMVMNEDAIVAYRELVLEHLDRVIGPPMHAMERTSREMAVTDATLAQCVGSRMLPAMLKRLLNGP